MIAYRNIDKEEDAENAFGGLKKTIAALTANVKDAELAQTLTDILGEESIDIPPAAPANYESPPGTESPFYHRESMPEPDWLAVRDQGQKIISWKIVATSALACFAAVTETLSLGQIDQILGPINVILGNTGLIGLGGDLHAIQNKIKVQELWRQYNLKMHRPTIPRERELSNLYRRGIISSMEYGETMERHGYDYMWSFGMHEGNTRYPGAGELLTMYRRGLLDQASFRKYLEFQGFDIKTSHIYAVMKEPLHTTSALIQQVVKEVITPEQFIESMALQGWSKEEAQKYWDVHWKLVSLDDLMDMRNRGLITNEKFGEMLIRHDYHPDWIEHLKEISYKNPTLRQFRQIMEYTDITDAEIDYALQTFGFAPEWEPVMRKFLTSRRLTTERTRMINELETNYVKGYLDESSFRSELSKMGLGSDVVDLRIERSQLRYDREIKDDMKGIFIQAYRNDFITEQQLWEELIGLGIQGEIVTIILNQEAVRKKPAAS